LIHQDFFNCIVFDFDCDDHGVVLLVVEAVEVVICEYDGGHTSFVMGLGDVVDGLYVAEVFLSGRRGGASACEATRDGVNGASQGGVGRGDVGVGGLWLLVIGLGGVVIVVDTAWLSSVVVSWRVVGSGGGVVILADEVAKVAGAYQFFDLILDRFALFCSMTMIAVVSTILGHVSVRRGGCFAWWGEEVSL